MACGATLKRPRELDPVMSPSSDNSMKRRRTTTTTMNPFVQFHHQQHDSSSVDSELMPSTYEPVANAEGDPLDARIHAEIRSIRHHQRQHHHPARGNQSPSPSSSSDSDSEQRMDGSFGNARQQPTAASCSTSGGGDRPLFTYAQLRAICERLLKEQEMRLRDEYEQTLNTRLAEQHDTFVRFTYDQIHRRFGEAPMSYLS